MRYRIAFYEQLYPMESVTTGPAGTGRPLLAREQSLPPPVLKPGDLIDANHWVFEGTFKAHPSSYRIVRVETELMEENAFTHVHVFVNVIRNVHRLADTIHYSAPSPMP